VTVKVTLRMPGCWKRCSTRFPSAVEPSPKSQVNCPAAIVEPLPSNVTGWPAITGAVSGVIRAWKGAGVTTSSCDNRATIHDRPGSPRKWMLLIGVDSSLLNTLTRIA
jgi:hypothetical protein